MGRTMNSIKAVQQGLPFVINVGMYFGLEPEIQNRVESKIEYTAFDPTGGVQSNPKVYGKVEFGNLIPADSEFTFTIAALVLKELIPEGKDLLFHRTLHDGSGTSDSIDVFDSVKEIGEYIQGLYDDGTTSTDGYTMLELRVGIGSNRTIDTYLIEYELEFYGNS